MIIIGGKEESILGKQADKLLSTVGLTLLDKRYIDSCSAAMQELNKGKCEFVIVYGEDNDPRVLCSLHSKISISTYRKDISKEIHRIYVTETDIKTVKESIKEYYRLADIIEVSTYEEAIEKALEDSLGVAVLEDKLSVNSLTLVDRLIKIEDKVERQVNLLVKKEGIPKCNIT